MHTVVVGAGIGGLAAALRLQQGGADVTVVEASDRIGGRLMRQRIAGLAVDGGGAWVGPTQDRIHSLLAELGLTTAPTYDSGKHLFRFGGRTRARRGSVPALPLRALFDLGLAQLRLDRLARHLPTDSAAPAALRLDRISVAEWADERLRTKAARGVLEIAVGANFGCRLEEMSMFALAAHVRGAGGLTQLTGVRGAAQDSRIVGGAVGACERIAERLARPVVLDSPVRRIRQDDGWVQLDLDGRTLASDRAIVAVDPALTAAIDFAGALDPRRQRLNRDFVMGTGIKFHIAYERPFWRERGCPASSSPTRALSDSPSRLPARLRGRKSWSGSSARRVTCWSPATVRPERPQSPGRSTSLSTRRPSRSTTSSRTGTRSPSSKAVSRPRRPAPSARPARGRTLRPAGSTSPGAERCEIWEGHMDAALRSAERAAAEVLATPA